MAESTPMNCKIKIVRSANSVRYPTKEMSRGFICTLEFKKGSDLFGLLDNAEKDKRISKLCDSIEKTVTLKGQVLVCELVDMKWEAIVTNYKGVPIIYSERALAEINRPISTWYKYSIQTCSGFFLSLQNMPITLNNIQTLNQGADNCKNIAELSSKYNTDASKIAEKLLSIAGSDNLKFIIEEGVKILSGYEVSDNSKQSPQEQDFLKFFGLMNILLSRKFNEGIPESQTTTISEENLPSMKKDERRRVLFQITRTDYSRTIERNWYLKVFSCATVNMKVGNMNIPVKNRELLTTSKGLLSTKSSFQYYITIGDEEVWFEIWTTNYGVDSKMGKGSTCRKIITPDSAKIWPSDKELTIYYGLN